MSETKLEKARAYEEAVGSKVPADLRPRYHLSSRCGWMNDPNGFSFYGGKYHMFYQYYPYDNKWGPMHWAHAESTDLLHWEYLPVILAPEEDYDGFGCFSGSCCITGVSKYCDRQNRHHCSSDHCENDRDSSQFLCIEVKHFSLSF